HHVDLDAHYLAVVEAGEGCVDRVLADVGDDDLASLVEQVADDADADAVGAPGDEGRAAGEVLHLTASTIASNPRTGLPGPDSRPGRNSFMIRRSLNSQRPSTLRSWSS